MNIHSHPQNKSYCHFNGKETELKQDRKGTRESSTTTIQYKQQISFRIQLTVFTFFLPSISLSNQLSISVNLLRQLDRGFGRKLRATGVP